MKKPIGFTLNFQAQECDDIVEYIHIQNDNADDISNIHIENGCCTDIDMEDLYFKNTIFENCTFINCNLKTAALIMLNFINACLKIQIYQTDGINNALLKTHNI